MAAATQHGGSIEAARGALLDGVDELFVAADSDLGSAVVDLAVGPALLRRVARPQGDADLTDGAQLHGGADPQGAARVPATGWLRMYRPVPTVGFSRLDTRARHYSRAVAAAQGHGFEAAVRSPGGRAAAYHRSCLCFELVLPDPGRRSPAEAMSALGDLLAGVLRWLGVDARVGEVPGEYCPGRFSVNAGGVAKIVGTAGRRVRGGILLGGSVIVADAGPIRDVLAEVYPALGLTVDLVTVAAAADVGCTVDSVDAMGDALLSALAPAVQVSLARLPAVVIAEANSAFGARLMVG
jgi:hypothetical protein